MGYRNTPRMRGGGDFGHWLMDYHGEGLAPDAAKFWNDELQKMRLHVRRAGGPMWVPCIAATTPI